MAAGRRLGGTVETATNWRPEGSVVQRAATGSAGGLKGHDGRPMRVNSVD